MSMLANPDRAQIERLVRSILEGKAAPNGKPVDSGHDDEFSFCSCRA